MMGQAIGVQNYAQASTLKKSTPFDRLDSAVADLLSAKSSLVDAATHLLGSWPAECQKVPEPSAAGLVGTVQTNVDRIHEAIVEINNVTAAIRRVS